VPDLETALLVSAVLLWLGMHYGLIVWAMRDLARRDCVRGKNKVLWAFLILIVPVIGPIAYSIAAPVTPLARPSRAAANRQLVTPDDLAR
jgi:hypothetical protein